MSLKTALTKFVCRKVSNSMYEREVAKAKDKSYDDVAKDIANAKKTGRYFNATKRYYSNLAERQSKAKERRDLREKFINDL